MTVKFKNKVNKNNIESIVIKNSNKIEETTMTNLTDKKDLENALKLVVKHYFDCNEDVTYALLCRDLEDLIEENNDKDKNNLTKSEKGV